MEVNFFLSSDTDSLLDTQEDLHVIQPLPPKKDTDEPTMPSPSLQCFLRMWSILGKHNRHPSYFYLSGSISEENAEKSLT